MLLLIMFPCVWDWKEPQFRMCISRIWQLRWSSQSLADLHINVGACYVAVPVLHSGSGIHLSSKPQGADKLGSGHAYREWPWALAKPQARTSKRVAPMPRFPPSYIYWPIDHGALSCWAQMLLQNSCQHSAPDSDYQSIRTGWNKTNLPFLL